MNTVSGTSNMRLGIFGGCLQILAMLTLYTVTSRVEQINGLIVDSLTIVLPILINGIFIKYSMVREYCHNNTIAGYQLFHGGYATGVYIVVTSVIILRIAELINTPELLSDIKTLSKLLYVDIALIGIGIIGVILISYTLYHLITHHRLSSKCQGKESLRRLPFKKTSVKK